MAISSPGLKGHQVLHRAATIQPPVFDMTACVWPLANRKHERRPQTMESVAASFSRNRSMTSPEARAHPKSSAKNPLYVVVQHLPWTQAEHVLESTWELREDNKGSLRTLDVSVQDSMEDIWALTRGGARGDRRDKAGPTYSSQHIDHSDASQSSCSQTEQAQAMMLRGDAHEEINVQHPLDNAVNEHRQILQQLNNDYDPSFGINPQALRLPLQSQPSVPVQPTHFVHPTLPVEQPVAQQPIPTPQPAHSQPQLFRYIAPMYDSSQGVYAPAPQLYTQGDQPFPGLISGGSGGPFAVGVVPVPSYPAPQKQLAGTRKKTGGPSRKQTARGTGDAELAAKKAAKKNGPAQYPGLVAEGQCMMGGECVHFKGTKCNWAQHFKAHRGCCEAANEKWVCRWSPGCGLPLKDRVLLAMHVMNHHLGVKYLCKCGRDCSTSYTLDRHINNPPEDKGAFRAVHGYAGQTNFPVVEAGPST